MPAEQAKIYFACGDNVKRLLSLPQAEQLRDKGFDVLCMTSQIDEYFVDTMKSYDDKPFCNIATDDLGLESEEEKKRPRQSRPRTRSCSTSSRRRSASRSHPCACPISLCPAPCA